MSPNNMDDEALARMLQELEVEQARHASQRNLNNASSQQQPVVVPSAPVMFDSFSGGTAATSATSSSSMEHDEEYAHQVQEELRRSDNRNVLPERPSPERDVEYAMKVEQEMVDEEVARRLEQAEQEAANAEMARRTSRGPQRRGRRSNGSPWTFRRLCILAIPVLIAAGVAIALFLVFSGNVDDIPFLGPNENDGFNGKNVGDINQWPADGNGLELELLNAMDNSWQEEFEIAVNDWENGTPDVLTLSTTVVDYEKECTPERGVMKVCNGDYGNTGWRGINSLSIQNGWIVRSVALMNDYYLRRASQADRIYTTCHEIGHGWGLPHTDEDFTNEDLGNCMDYTNTPKNNMQPDESNFSLLASLYGTVDGSNPQQGNDPDGQRALDVDECSLPDVMARYKDYMTAFEQGTQHESTDCQLKKENNFASVWHIRLSSQCSMQVHLLRA